MNDLAIAIRSVDDTEAGAVPVHVATQAGAVTGVAFEVVEYGYSGKIRVLLGVAPDGTLLGVRVLSHTETPGPFIALIVTNCAILGRAEAFASRNGVLPSAVDGLMMGIGFTLALTFVGGVRDILGAGTVFARASLLPGAQFSFLEVTLFPDYPGFLIIILPPGGFIVLGFIFAAKHLIDARKPTIEQEIKKLRTERVFNAAGVLKPEQQA